MARRNLGSVLRLIALAVLGLESPLAAQTPKQLLAAQAPRVAPSLFRIETKDCWAAGPDSKPVQVSSPAGTGFAADIDGTTLLVSALHTVAGCRWVGIRHQSYSGPVRAVRYHRAADLVAFGMPDGVRIPGLPTASTSPPGGSDVALIGYGFPTQMIHFGTLRSGSLTLDQLFPQGPIRRALKKQTFPSLETHLLSLQLEVPPGASGAPILSSAGEVLGVGNGALEGTHLVSWAVPYQELRKLPHARDLAPLPTETVSDLRESTLLSRSPDEPAAAEILCGSVTFRELGSTDLTTVLATADDLSRQQIHLALGVAANAGHPVSAMQRFRIYTAAQSGASFAVPEEFSLGAGGPFGSPCVARDRDGSMEMHVLSRFLTPPMMQAESARFEQALFWPDQPQVSPSVTMPMPMHRADGMGVQRKAWVLHNPPAFPLGPKELVIGHTSRGNAYLAVATKSRISNGSWLTQTFFPAVVATYASGFNRN